MIDFLNYQNYISNYSYKLKISSLKYKNDLVLHLKIEINDFLRRKISGPRLVMGGSWVGHGGSRVGHGGSLKR